MILFRLLKLRLFPAVKPYLLKNVLLKAGTIKLSDVVVAKENVTLLADNNIALQRGLFKRVIPLQ